MNNGKYAPELVDAICQWIEDGVPNKHAAEGNGITQETFYTWIKEKPEFSERVKKAHATAVERNVKIVKTAANRTWQAAAWWLERRQKDDFSLKQEIDQNIRGEQTIIYKPEKKPEGEK